MGLGVIVIAATVLGATTELYKDPNVRVWQKRTALSAISPHARQPIYLSIFGKVYKNVRGTKPCFIATTEPKSIVFVTEESNESATLHIADFSSKKVTDIAASGLSFGGQIGFEAFGRKKGDSFTEWVEKFGQEELVLVTRYPDSKKTFYFNPAKRKLLRIEYEKLDQSGKAVSKSVYVDGEKIE